MKRYFIEKIECGFYGSGHYDKESCEKFIGLCFNDGEKSMWLTLDNSSGFLNWYLLEQSVVGDLVSDRFDIEFDEYLHNHYIEDFNGFNLESDPRDMYDIFSDDNSNEARLCLIPFYLSYLNEDEQRDNLNRFIGMFSDEIGLSPEEVPLY